MTTHRHHESSNNQRSKRGWWPNSWKPLSRPQNSLNDPATHSAQFSLVTQSCLTLCDSIESSMPGLPVHHQLPEFTQTHVLESVMPSNHLTLCCPLLLCLQSFPASGAFPVSRFFASDCRRTGVSGCFFFLRWPTLCLWSVFLSK